VLHFQNCKGNQETKQKLEKKTGSASFRALLKTSVQPISSTSGEKEIRISIRTCPPQPLDPPSRPPQ
jgi:hypothetical protein